MLLMIELNIMFNSLEQDHEGKVLKIIDRSIVSFVLTSQTPFKVLSRAWGEKLAERRSIQLKRYKGVLDRFAPLGPFA